MRGTGAASQLEFEVHSPGSWEMDLVHFPRPVTRYWETTHPEPFKRGFREFTRFYGMLIDSLAYQYIHGFCYTSLVPVERSQAPERFQRAEEVFRGKLWREQLREWDETFKPASVRAHRELQSVDPGSLSGPISWPT